MNNKELNTIESTSGCFQSLSAEELDFINKNKTTVRYTKGETIIKQSAFAPHVLFVNSGLVKVYIENGKKQLGLKLAKKGDFLAFESVFGAKKYKYSAQSLCDTTVCMIDSNALKELLVNNSGFALQITSRNYNEEKNLLDIIHNICFKQMRGKLASALIYFTGDDFKDENVFQFLTRQDIADFASITLESAIRFLKEFEKEQLIKIDGRQIEVLNREKLINLCEIG